MKYFRYLPKTDYSSNTATNIIVRAKIRDEVRRNTIVLYPYTIIEGDRPDIIAHKYYGTSDLAWLVFYSNDIVDPIYDWPLTYSDFNSYIIAKYESIEDAQQTIQYYYDAYGLIIDETTYLALPENERSFISVYDYENELNEAKRQIFLVDNDYAQQIVAEVKAIFR